MIDLRSDTVTLPTLKMREAIFNAQLGDDVLQEDLTVNKLEKKAAKIMGKESAMLVPSGTMGNLISILSWCERGTEIILGKKSHTFIYEAGGISAFGGIHSNQLKNQDDGTILLEDIKNAIRFKNVHFPKTSAISLENTHNMCSGSPLDTKYINSVANISKENNLKLHIDGARIFNAAIALNINVKDLVKNVDSVSFCLSKGLAAPIGSIICGSRKFIDKSRRLRKGLGGGMRQAGIIAAAGIISIEKMLNQIKKDHNNALLLAKGISSIDNLLIDLEKIKTNIIYFKLNSRKINGRQLVKKMENCGIKFFETEFNKFRLVTHLGITKKNIYTTIDAFKKCVK
tara:strand:- start:2168 stop:3196 length:1029 start_codon:yes stop_codon:yes gene_type:complete